VAVEVRVSAAWQAKYGIVSVGQAHQHSPVPCSCLQQWVPYAHGTRLVITTPPGNSAGALSPFTLCPSFPCCALLAHSRALLGHHSGFLLWHM
jgi:hypothetical protein